MVAMDKGSSGDLTQHNGLTKSQSCGLAFLDKILVKKKMRRQFIGHRLFRTLLQSVH